MAALIVIIVVVVFVLVVAARTIRVIPQARAGVVERLGRYSRTLEPGLTIVTPFIDRVKPLVDLREQVVNFSPQSVITEDNVVVGIETVLYFTITDPRSATYEIANPLQAIEQLTVTTLRNVIGGLTLEETLTARENVNTELRVVLDEATGKWGITDQSRRDQVGRPAAGHPHGDGEADARRARPPRSDPHGRRREAVADPHRRGRQAGGGADRRRRPAGGRARCRGRAPVGDPARRGRSEGDRHRLHGDPRGQTRSRAAQLRIPADAAAARRRRRQQGVRRALRVRAGLRRASARRWPVPPAARRTSRPIKARAPPAADSPAELPPLRPAAGRCRRSGRVAAARRQGDVRLARARNCRRRSPTSATAAR